MSGSKRNSIFVNNDQIEEWDTDNHRKSAMKIGDLRKSRIPNMDNIIEEEDDSPTIAKALF